MAACKRILFVCTGNTCRSPMAEAIFRQLVQERLAHTAGEITVMSAGTGAVEGMPAADHALQVMEERGLSLAGHRSQPVQVGMLRGADLILTMTRQHKEDLLQQAPEVADRTFTLKELAAQDAPGDEPASPEELDIPDPVGASPERYREVAAEIAEAVARVLPWCLGGESQRNRDPGAEG